MRTIKLSDHVRVLPTIALPVDGARIACDLIGLVCHAGNSAVVRTIATAARQTCLDTTCFLLLYNVYKRQLQ